MRIYPTRAHGIIVIYSSFGVQSNAIDKIYVYIPRSIKRMRLVILARKGISVVARVRWQKQTRYVYIPRSKRGKTPEMFL